jgi:hypothetical protein
MKARRCECGEDVFDLEDGIVVDETIDGTPDDVEHECQFSEDLN